MKSNAVFLAVALLIFGSVSPQSFSQTQSKDFSSEIASVRREAIETHDFKIKNLDVGMPTLGKNKFTATAKNKTKFPLVIGLDLATQPGLWLRRRFQNQFFFQMSPKEEKQIEASYEFLRMTEEAYLSVGFGMATTKAPDAFQIKDFFFQKRYYLGKGNKAVDYTPSSFNKYDSEHFEIYCYKGSLAEKELSGITQQRESAFREISDLLQVQYDRKIRLVFYPDGETKKREIGHQGDGYAYCAEECRSYQ